MKPQDVKDPKSFIFYVLNNFTRGEPGEGGDQLNRYLRQIKDEQTKSIFNKTITEILNDRSTENWIKRELKIALPEASIERLETKIDLFTVMTKTKLAAEIAKKSNMSKKNCTLVINSMIKIIKDSLKNGIKVQCIPFGSWEVKTRVAREGRNPQTGKKIKIPAKRVPVFKAGKALKEAVK